MSHNITQQQPESFLWEAADILRGNTDASEYKDYIFGIWSFAMTDFDFVPTKFYPSGEFAY